MKNGFEINANSISVVNFTESDVGHLSADHCHDKYEITYFLSASGKYIIEGTEQIIEPGTLVLINPMSYHRVMLNLSEDTEGYSIHFSRGILPDAVAQVFDSFTSSKEGNGCFYSIDAISDRLISVVDRFELAICFNSMERFAYMQALLSEIIVLLSTSEGEKITHTDDELGARVAKYLNNNIERSISLDKLARRFFVSKYHLCRAFKSYSGTTVHAYVNYKRIIYAKGLIESGVTASRAAERVGFGDYSAFYRAYVRIVGKSPTA